MGKRNWTDQELYRDILNGGRSREAALQYVYTGTDWKRTLNAWVKQGGGTPEDAEEVFQDSIIAFDRSIREGRFERKSALKTYFLGIAKRQWLKVLKKSNRQLPFGMWFEETMEDKMEELLYAKEKKAVLTKVIGMMGERCQVLLKLFGLDYSMKEIAEEVSLRDQEAAKKEVYRCRERLKKILDDNQDLRKLLE